MSARRLPCAAVLAAMLLGASGCGLGGTSVGLPPDATIIDAGPIDASPPELFGTTPGCAAQLRSHGDQLYWIETLPGDLELPRLVRSPEAAFAPAPVLPSALGILDYAVDDDDVYWISEDRLARTSIATGHSDFAASAARGYRAIELAGGTIFLITVDNGTTRLVALPGWGAAEVALLSPSPTMLAASEPVVLVSGTSSDTGDHYLDGYSGTTLSPFFGADIFPAPLRSATLLTGRDFTLDQEGVIVLHGLFQTDLGDAVDPVGPAALLPIGDRLVALFARQVTIVDVDARVMLPVASEVGDLAVAAHHFYWTSSCTGGSESTTIQRQAF